MKRWTTDDWAELVWLLFFLGLIVGVGLYAWLTHDTRCFGPEC